MRGVQASSDPWRIARSLAIAAQEHKFTRTGRETKIQTTVWCTEKPSLGGHRPVPPEDLQEALWQQFFQDTDQWWDNRQTKPSPRHPDFRHKESKVPLWLNNRHKPDWVDSLLAIIDAGLTTTRATECSTVEIRRVWATNEGHLLIAICRKLCEDGVISDAVDALDALVQRGCHVPSSLYYRVLKGCMRKKDLALGRRVHALTVESGYGRDAFLATHLIGLYASHGRLDEAFGVFSEVPTPDAYNWASIIFAYARHGGAAEAAEAIRLYRRMSDSSTVKPDDCLFSAVLKACAAAKDVMTGKNVHSHIFASKGQPSRFVQAGLVNMYAKCGSLEDARRLFDTLSEKDAVTWTLMISGYAQQGRGHEALYLYRLMQQDGLTPDSVTYVCLLQACACVGVGALHEGKRLHVQIEEQGLQESVLGGSLVNMYAKCGSLQDARRIFDKLEDRNIVAWNAMIAGYAHQGMGCEALSLYMSMKREGFAPDSVTYACLLQACARVGVGALNEGKQLHAMIEDQGLEKDAVVGRSLVNMYAKCGSLGDARRLFDKLPNRTVVAWNAMIAGYAQQGMGQDALCLYNNMQQEGLTPDAVTFVGLLQACATVGVSALHEGKQLHAQIRDQGLEEDVVMCGSLVNMYAKCGCFCDARRLLDKLQHCSIVAWNAMIGGYAQHGMGQEALRLYSVMQHKGLTPDSVTYVGLLQACATLGVGALPQGKQLHVQIEERGLEEDAAVRGSLVSMYANCGSLLDARQQFDKLTDRNVLAWNTMIAGYVHQGMGQEALNIYHQMQQDGFSPDSVTYVCLLQACACVGLGALNEGKQLHVRVEERGLEEDAVLGGSLVNMYAKCGSLEDARRLFDKLLNRDVVAWNAIVAGYAQQGMGQKALTLHGRMQQDGLTADAVTYVSVLQACASIGVGALHEGKQLHVQIEERGMEEDAVLGGSLVNMYSKCGSLKDARILFEKLPHRNVIAWNAMVAGYAQQEMGQEALGLYSRMRKEGVTPDSVTYVCLLQACGALAALPLGEQLHAEIEERGMLANDNVGAALVNMYAKCGSICDSQRVFDSLRDRSIETWNALISGYARQGDSQVVFDLFFRMRLERVHPDEITFLSVLTVCSHAGLVDKGRKFFDAMRTEYGISANMEHYVCLVDLLGRAGLVHDALVVARCMPFPANDVVWQTLLGACRKWKKVEIGEEAFKGAVSVDRKDASAYVLMSNIYASTQMWEASKEMQARRTKLGAWKKPGQSWWTDVKGVVHTFLVGDKKHPESEGIYCRLEQLIPKLKKEGYVPHLASSLQDLPDDKKQAELYAHSEKLAIAYALNKTPEGSTIRIVKNLRVCEDCHAAIGYISRVEKRTIICRDVSRFHVYIEGKCSCGDYW